MVQICVKIPEDGDGSVAEWVMIELQGDLQTKSQVASLSGKFIGDLCYTKKGVPVFIVGHHILYGKVVEMEKPLLAMTKRRVESASNSDNVEQPAETEQMETDKEHTRTEYCVRAVIQKKLVFKTRPKPIIANLPKKV